MKRNLLLLYFSFLALYSYSQDTFYINVANKVANEKLVHGENFMIVGDFEGDIVDDTLLIQNYNIVKYAIIKLKLQLLKNNPDVGFVNVLAGFSDVNKGILIVDNNRNNSFADDSLFSYPLYTDQQADSNYIDKIPALTINNIPLLRKDGQIENFSFKIKCDIGLASKIRALVESDIRKVKKLTLRILIDQIYEGYLNFREELYKVTYLKNCFSLYANKFKGFDYYNSLNLISLTKITKNKLDSLIGKSSTDVVTSISFNLDSITELQILEHAPDADILKLQVHQIKKNTVQPTRPPDEFVTKNLKGNSAIKLTSAEGKLTLLVFTGSWCLPCKIIKPSLDSFIVKYKNYLRVVVIAVENNQTIAKAYLSKENYYGDWFYEPFSTTNSKNLLKIFYNVNAFPQLLLFDVQGEIIHRKHGSDCVEEFKKIMKIIYN